MSQTTPRHTMRSAVVWALGVAFLLCSCRFGYELLSESNSTGGGDSRGGTSGGGSAGIGDAGQTGSGMGGAAGDVGSSSGGSAGSGDAGQTGSGTGGAAGSGASSAGGSPDTGGGGQAGGGTGGSGASGGTSALCPSDTDVDGDETCDSEDVGLSYETTIDDLWRPVVSADKRYLFGASGDRKRLRAFDVTTLEQAVVPVPIVDLALAPGMQVEHVHLLPNERVAVTLADQGTSDVRILRIYSFDGSDFSLVEDIETTDIRLYDIAYHAASDRLFWSNFNTSGSVYYYDLGQTALGHSGMGTRFATSSEQGTYGLIVSGDRLIRLRGTIDAFDLQDDSLIHHWNTGGGEVTPGYNNARVWGDYLLFVNRWVAPVRFTVHDISDITMPVPIGSVALLNAEAFSSLAVRPSETAVVLVRQSQLAVIDLRSLPAPPSLLQKLEPPDLDGLFPDGGVDCRPPYCYADTTDEVTIVLGP